MTILAAEAGWWGGILREVRNPWQGVLLVGQVVFFSRFLVQWIASERRKRVVMPVAFWWLSISGAGISLVALTALRQPVLIAAQVAGIALYSRNLVLHHRSTAEAGERGPAAP